VRILFVFSLRDVLTANRPLATLGDIHVGLSYISACLKERQHTTQLLVLSSEWRSSSLSRLETTVREFDPQIVAFTAVSTQFPFIQSAAELVSERWPEKFLLLGGMHASLRPAEAIQGPFNAICIGEGEFPTVELAEQLTAGKQPSGIANLWFKRADGSIERNPTREFLPNLDQLPFPDRQLWEDWVMSPAKTHHMLQPSRGCPFGCTYCSNHAIRKISGGKYVRFRSPASILSELRHLKERYPELESLYLQSETIAVDLEWLETLSHQVHELNQQFQPPIAFACNFRVTRSLLTDSVFGALERLGVRTIEIGLESGSERLRAQVLRRNYTNEEFVQAVTLARRHGMKVNVYNMIGLPGESLSDYEETVAVNHQVCPDQSLTSIFFPYPGTDLYERCQEQGLLKDLRQVTSERDRPALNLPGFSTRQIQTAYDWFEYRIYAGHRPFHYRLRKVLRNKIRSHKLSHLVFMRCLPLWYALRRRGAR
jgi:radical SAM superfamily enzyme YgiQ (UPF0313 family)